jgi:hypothetical protein
MKVQIEQLLQQQIFSSSTVLFLSFIKSKAEKHAERGEEQEAKD